MYNFKINAAVREYFNYRYDEASFQLEEAKLNGFRVPMERDFRTRTEKQEDHSGAPVEASHPADRLGSGSL